MGESLTLHVSDVLFETIEDAQRARHVDCYAYLVHGFDRRALERAMSRPEPGRWWDPSGPITKIGTVELVHSDGNLVPARVRLTIPQVPPGSYDLMLCDSGCRTPLANLIPSAVHVTDDPVAAQTSRKLQDRNARLDLALAQVRSDLRDARRELRKVERDAAKANDAVARLNARLVTPRARPATPWVAYAGWFLAGAAIALLASRRRLRTPPASRDAIVERIPDDARELVGSR